MAYELSIPFYAFRLHFSSGKEFITPLTDLQALRLKRPLRIVAGQYAEALQKKVLDKGSIMPLLDEYQQGHFFKHRLSVSFPAARDGISYPDFQLEFDYFHNEGPSGHWGIIPVLGIEAYAEKADELEQRLEEAVRLDFTRHQRFNAVQEIIATIWFESVELLQQEIKLQVLSPNEVDEAMQQPSEKLLPQIAQRVKIEQPITFGRDTALKKLERILKNEFSRNALIVGPSGVGKTALVWEMARQFDKRKIKGQIWETTASTLIKELTRDTGWQDNLTYLCQELSGGEDILYVRNLMELFEVGKYEGNEVSIADYLRTYLSRGEVTLISECTDEEMAMIELKSPQYLSLFQVVRLEEPKENLEEIILKKVNTIARSRKIAITENAIREVIRLNRRFTPYSGMPGKPIRFLESILVNKPAPDSGRPTDAVTSEEVIQHFCEETGMPLFMIEPSVPMNIQGIKMQFNECVFGQERAVDSVVDLLASVKTALTRTGKPIASLLFVGPTGVGKTELAKVLAEFMFGNRERLTRFDMSEFSSPYTVMRLVGTDYFSEGLLTAAIRREPFTVLLFDEIEKAHPSFYDLLLQILGEGRLTDSQGKLVNFCSTIIIMTSNIGAGDAMGQRISWSREQPTGEVETHFMSAVQRHFRPELFNRIDQVISFSPLDRKTIRYIVEREMEQFREREGIKFRRLDLDIEAAVLDFLGERGYDGKYGARHLQRTIREQLILPLARRLNAEDPDDQLMVKIRMMDGSPRVSIDADPLGIELLLEELDKIQHADHSSKLRRKVSQLKEGHAFVQLLNELEMLERQKARQKKKFWNNQALAERYSYLLKSKERLDKLRGEIESLEIQLSLASLHVESYDTELVREVEKWESVFFDFKVELYTRLNPDDNKCYLGVYSSQPQAAAAFYFSLLGKMGIPFSVNSIWFRESHYNRAVKISERSSQNHAGEDVKKYLEKKITPEELDTLVPPRRGDLLYGIEIQAKAPAVFLYFREEMGIQRWHLDEDPVYCHVHVSNHPFPTPAKIHRKEFYASQSPRRFLESNLLRDTLYKINREVHPQELTELMSAHLDQRFKVKIDLEVQ